MEFEQIRIILLSFSNYLLSIPIISLGLSKYSDDEVKADWQPPGYVFAIVWPILYLLFGIINLKIYYSKKIPKTIKVDNLDMAFEESLIQTGWLIVNGKYFHKRFLIQYIVGFCIILYLLVYAYFLRIPMLYQTKNKSLVYMYIPYTLWISFAAILNYQLIRNSL
ncbi:hypothetical protein CL656_03310 [bacterium]|nr:hypothetical protein [bacterium]|tara:strand:- start:1497 stop:1991 length:495 start_codon:yes stop_codon:yes gene_type:complete